MTRKRLHSVWIVFVLVLALSAPTVPAAADNGDPLGLFAWLDDVVSWVWGDSGGEQAPVASEPTSTTSAIESDEPEDAGARIDPHG